MTTWPEINAKKYSEMAFSMIQAANLDVNDFVEELYPPTFRIVYRPTRDYFAFGGENGGAMWTRPGYLGKTSQTSRGNFQSWDVKIRYFERWLGQLQEFLAALKEHSKHEQPPAPELPQPRTAAGHGGNDLPEAHRKQTPLPTELLKPMRQQAAPNDPDREPQSIITKAPRRTPDLEKSRERLAFFAHIATELATLKQDLKGHCTAASLKKRYPGFLVWKFISKQELEEIVGGDPFTPKTFAENLTLRKFGITSRETLKKDRHKIKRAERGG